jgi:hypothetical protein
MDFSIPSEKKGKVNGITILCHQDTPNYPAAWILRNTEVSMQKIFPPRKGKD